MARLVEGIAAFAQIEVAHLALDAPGIAQATAEAGTPGSDFREDAVEPALAVLRGE